MIKETFNENWIFYRLGKNSTPTLVSLPHDAMFTELRTKNSAGGTNTGWYEGHDYCYEKTFYVPIEWKDKEVIFEFEGVYREAEVFLNGEKAAFRPNGYINFYVHANPFLKYEQENKICVIAHNKQQPNSRWYSGAGIYRPVWLYVLPQEHIVLDGIKITTLDYKRPTICVDISVIGSGEATIEIFDGSKLMARKSVQIHENIVREAIVLENAKLWEIERPYLYTCKVNYGGDERKERFGIRHIECDSRRGFCLNGKRVIMRGACVHHDNGLLGAVAHPYAEYRKIRLLKEAGFNAIRSAHNPCSVAMLNACDELGMLVIDEYVDMWYIHKTKYDFATYFEEWWKQDLQDLVSRDYNHASVVMYSIGNEVSETAQTKGIELCSQMKDWIHVMDSRPVTCGINIFFNFLNSIGFGVYSDKKAQITAEGKKKKAVGSEFFNQLTGILGAEFMKFGATLYGSDKKTYEAFSKLDVAGYNYGIKRYKKDLRKYPDRVILGSETFCFDVAQFWELAKENPALIGDFVWAGMDYLGEVGIGAMEYKEYAPEFEHGVGWISAGVGMLDLTGQTTGQMAYMQVAYEKSPVRIAVVPVNHTTEKHSPSAWRMSNAIESWSWNGCEGMLAKVEVYAKGQKVELFLNGRKIGCKQLYQDCRTVFRVKWESGELMAVVYDSNDEEVGRAYLSSAKDETKFTLLPEKETIRMNELCYVRMKYTDDEGNLKPLIRGDIQVSVKGGTLLALGSACPYNRDGFQRNVTDTYYGEALAIIKPNNIGEIQIVGESFMGKNTVVVNCVN